MSDMRKALLLFSGGQDSATCLAWACETFDHVETIGFDYAQRHDVEMECRLNVLREMRAAFPKWDAKMGEDHVVDLSSLGAISETALTRESEIFLNESGLPNTFVPGRNLIFLNFAAAVGYRRHIQSLIGGMCEADFSGYPDCRKETLDAVMTSISLGLDRAFKLQTPLMNLSKAGAWALAEKLGGETLINIILEHSHTCYAGQRGERRVWGYGCGVCPACEIRARGWEEFTAA